MAPKKTKAEQVEKKESNPKLEALDTALKNIDKEYGKGAILRMGDRPLQDIAVISTGSLDVDFALGVGGLPRGRIVEIYGPESSGKTTLALHAVAQAQKNGGIAAFVDAEHALDPIYAKRLGVDIDNLYVSQPDTGEQALGITEMLVSSGAIDIIVVDSVAALVPQKEIEGEIGDSFVGLQARLMSQALRKLTGAVSKTNCVLIFINQIREKVGVLYGNPETTPGGRALKFYSSVRIDVRGGEQIKEGGVAVGKKTKAKIVKNKVAPPFRVAEFEMLFGEGISREGSLVDHAVEMDIIHKSGAWFSYNDEKIAQGKEKCRQYLKDSPAFADEIEQKVRAEMRKQFSAGMGTAPDAAAQEADTDEDELPEEEGAETGDLLDGLDLE